MAKYDRSVEDIGNVVMLEHVNTRVPDQHLATAAPGLLLVLALRKLDAGREESARPAGRRGRRRRRLPERLFRFWSCS